jgi:bifunctional enzyme CysN/CysC
VAHETRPLTNDNNMSHQSDLIATDIEAYLAQHERKEMLRFLTCGSVDDGKSTLIGRLLHDTKMIYEDQLAAITKDSTKHGTTGEAVDLALLTDGLKAEREQGITIDVAYRYFSTARRKFIIADTPGHEQYTRNMATGASCCDLAIILIDARQGVLVQTKRHSFIVSLLGIKHVVVAINKMDLVGYSEEVFEKIKADYSEFATRLEIGDLHFVPICAKDGDNVVDPSQKMPWYSGSTLMHHLENVHIASDRNLVDFRFPVQYVLRPNLNFRGFAGTLASGVVRPGDEVMVLPSRKTAKVKSIVTMDGELDQAFAPQSVTITLDREVDVSRGEMLVPPHNLPRIDNQVETMIIWMNETPMVPGKQYLIKQSTKTTSGAVTTMRYQVDVNTLRRKEAPTLALNEIGRCALQLSEPIAYDPYKRNKSTGSFIIIDRLTNITVGAGMILDRSPEGRRDHWDDAPSMQATSESHSAVTAEERSARFGQKAATILLTGLTGSGKTTIAYALERRLFSEGRACSVIDGEKLRRGISRDIGFTADERSENLRRGAEVARILNDAGLICITALIAPSEEVRLKAKELVGVDKFVVVHLDAPIEVCRARDTAGQYKKADEGLISNFPGVSSPYEPPTAPDLVLKTDKIGVQECVEKVVGLLKARGILV